MKLYHGGLVAIQTPRILAAEHVGDFGTGFYTTTDREQARRTVVELRYTGSEEIECPLK